MNNEKIWILSNGDIEFLALETDGQFRFFGSHTVYTREVLEKSFQFVRFELLENVSYFIRCGPEGTSGQKDVEMCPKCGQMVPCFGCTPAAVGH